MQGFPNLDLDVFRESSHFRRFGYGSQLLAKIGREVLPCEIREYGVITLSILIALRLLKKLRSRFLSVDGHGDPIKDLPVNFLK